MRAVPHIEATAISAGAAPPHAHTRVLTFREIEDEEASIDQIDLLGLKKTDRVSEASSMAIGLTHLNAFTMKPAQEGSAEDISSKPSKWQG
jgi:hypothetical protein